MIVHCQTGHWSLKSEKKRRHQCIVECRVRRGESLMRTLNLWGRHRHAMPGASSGGPSLPAVANAAGTAGPARARSTLPSQQLVLRRHFRGEWRLPNPLTWTSCEVGPPSQPNRMRHRPKSKLLVQKCKIQSSCLSVCHNLVILSYSNFIYFKYQEGKFKTDSLSCSSAVEGMYTNPKHHQLQADNNNNNIKFPNLWIYAHILHLYTE